MPVKTKVQKRAAWTRKFNANYRNASKAAGHKDSIGSITSKKGQALSQKARTKTNKEMGYTERSVLR